MKHLPIFHHNLLVNVAIVDEEFFSLLSQRRWHLSNTRKDTSPRTSISTSKGSRHLFLSRVVIALDRLKVAERVSFWDDVETAWNLTLKVPKLSPRNPFDCRVASILENIELSDLQITNLSKASSGETNLSPQAILHTDSSEYLGSPKALTTKLSSVDLENSLALTELEKLFGKD